MTNVEIIESIKKEQGIQEELLTFMEWKFRGYSVKKGERAKVQTKLWKKVRTKANAEESEGGEINSGFVLVKSSLFGRSQVEKLEGAC